MSTEPGTAPPVVRVCVVGSGPRTSALAGALGSAVPGAVVVHGDVRLPAAAVPPEQVDAVLLGAGSPVADLLPSYVEAGRPVLWDPAAGLDVALVREVAEAEAAAGRRLVQVGLARRHDPRFRELRAQVADGTLGAVRLVRAVRDDRPAEAVGGGRVERLAEELDTLTWLLGDRVASLRWEPLDGLGLATATTAGGVVADLELRESPADAPPGEDDGDRGQVRWEVVGDAASAELVTGPAYLAEADRIMLTAFVRAAAAGGAVGAGAADALAALDAVAAVGR